MQQSRQLDEDSVAGIISTRRQAAAEAERRRGEDAEDVSSAHMADPLSQVCLSPLACNLTHFSSSPTTFRLVLLIPIFCLSHVH